MFWLISGTQMVFADPIFWDQDDENWFHQIDELNGQVVFGGRIHQSDGTYAWLYSWDQEWSLLATERSEMQAMATNNFQIALCGLTREQEDPKSWAWFVDENGNSVRQITLVEEGISNCTSIISYQSGWLASVVLRGATDKQSVLLFISPEGEVEQVTELFNDIEIMGISLHENGTDVAVTGFLLEPDKTSGWIGVIDQNLQLKWEQKLGFGAFNKFKNISKDEDGNLLSCGYTTIQGPDNWDIWLLHWDWEGNILFETIWGGDLRDGCKGFKPSSSGFVFIGDSESFEADDWDILRGEVDFAGNMTSWEVFGEQGDDYGYDFLQDGNRLFWVGALERDEDGKRVAWAELSILPEESQNAGDILEINEKCGCNDSQGGWFVIPLIGFFWSRRRD